jgi:hypothetical protein
MPSPAVEFLDLVPDGVDFFTQRLPRALLVGVVSMCRLIRGDDMLGLRRQLLDRQRRALVAGMPGTRARASTKSRTNFRNARPDPVLVTTSCAAAEAVFRRSEALTTNSVYLTMEFQI